MMLDIATASIADVFAYLLEVQDHAALDPNATNESGYGYMPNYSCRTWKGGGFFRGSCPACIALRKYRLDQGMTEEEIERSYEGGGVKREAQ